MYIATCIAGLFPQNKNYAGISRVLILALSCLALLAQGSGMLLLLYHDAHDSVTWILPVSILLSSCRWWLNYASIHSCCGNHQFLSNLILSLW